MLSWNTAFLLSVNATSKPDATRQHLVEAVANAPVLMVPVLMAAVPPSRLWIWGSPARRAALIAAETGHGSGS